MPDYLDTLAEDAKETISSGYYEVPAKHVGQPVSLRKAIIESRQNAIITEVKVASPSRGTIKTSIDPSDVAKAMEDGGATGISVLTEPKHFSGSLGSLVYFYSQPSWYLHISVFFSYPTSFKVSIIR